MKKKSILLLTSILFCTLFLKAQDSISSASTWDNQIFLGNKVSWGKEKWKYSGELQTRLIENARTLDRWYIEGVSSYMPNKNWEIVPDFRISFRPNNNEYRPGFGILRKDLFKKGEEIKHQLVHQVKLQADFKPEKVDFGLRYIAFYNYIVSKKIVTSVMAGVFYSWMDQFQGIQYVRGGAGIAYLINVQHSVNLSYFAGAANLGDSWNYQGSLVVQLVININKDYKYVPAKYINF